MVQGQRCPDWMLRSIVVVPGGCNVVPTICYGTGGEGMDGDQRCEEEDEEEAGHECSSALSPAGCCGMGRTAALLWGSGHL